jgi:hypothetical protein
MLGEVARPMTSTVWRPMLNGIVCVKRGVGTAGRVADSRRDGVKALLLGSFVVVPSGVFGLERRLWRERQRLPRMTVDVAHKRVPYPVVGVR